MIDPVDAFAMMVTATPTHPIGAHPTALSSSSVAPIPTVLPGNTPIYHVASETGKRTLWVVTVVMGVASLVFYAMAFRVPVQKRLFHVLTALITTFAFLSYFAMATGDGIATLHSSYTEHHDIVPPTTQDIYTEVYWARYVDWTLTTPLLLIDLSLLAGLNGASMTIAVIADVIMILTGLFAGFGRTGGQKWGWYTIACIAFLVIPYQVLGNGRKFAAQKDAKTKKFFFAIAVYTMILWTVYPIVWGFADGSRTVSVDGEIIAYAVLDILAKPIFGLWLLFTHDATPATSLTVDGFWAHGLGNEGTIRVGDDEEA